MLINLPLVVFAVEFTLDPLSLDRVLFDLVNIFSLYVFRVYFLGDDKVTLNDNEDLLGQFALLNEQAVLGHIDVLEVRSKFIESGSIGLRLIEEWNLLLHEVDLLVSLVQLYLLPCLLVVIHVNCQEVSSLGALDGSEPGLSINQSQLTERASTL